jgi:hypothetical protein
LRDFNESLPSDGEDSMKKAGWKFIQSRFCSLTRAVLQVASV